MLFHVSLYACKSSTTSDKVPSKVLSKVPKNVAKMWQSKRLHVKKQQKMTTIPINQLNFVTSRADSIIRSYFF